MNLELRHEQEELTEFERGFRAAIDVARRAKKASLSRKRVVCDPDADSLR